MCDNIILYVVLNISNKNIVRNLRNLVRNWEIEGSKIGYTRKKWHETWGSLEKITKQHIYIYDMDIYYLHVYVLYNG